MMDIIVAVYSDWGIGCSGTQPIVIAEDRQYFKEKTNGAIVISGRRTFEDFGKPLPNRKNIILTSDRDYKINGAVVVHSVEELMAEIADAPEQVFVIGGESIYRTLLPMCSHAYVTKIELAPESDTFFPNLDELPDWSLDSAGEVRESDGVRYSFCEYVRDRG